jgi:hypothetical protein
MSPEDNLLPEDREWLAEHGWRDTSADYPAIGTEASGGDAFRRLLATWCIAVWTFVAVAGIAAIWIDPDAINAVLGVGIVAIISTIGYIAERWIG